MTKTSIETINGKLYTVIWNNEYDAKAAEETPLDFIYGNDEFMTLQNGVLILHQLGEPFATALPALPRNPKPEDAALLHRYASEGISVQLYDKMAQVPNPFLGAQYWLGNEYVEITGALDFDGNRIEVAIEGK